MYSQTIFIISIGQNVKGNTLKLLEESIGKNICSIGVGKNFLITNHKGEKWWTGFHQKHISYAYTSDKGNISRTNKNLPTTLENCFTAYFPMAQPFYSFVYTKEERRGGKVDGGEWKHARLTLPHEHSYRIILNTT